LSAVIYFQFCYGLPTSRIYHLNITSKYFERLDWDPRLRARKTTTDFVVDALRAAIYDGQFQDNEELNQVELALHFGVSRVPIREALRQLQAEGLVRAIAHHRAIVVGLTIPEILEAIEMRAVLESHLLQRSGALLSPQDLLKLRDLCDEGAKITDYGPDWVLKNWDFHRTLYSKAASPNIIDTIERAHLRVERYTRRTGTRERRREGADEHFLIVDELENGRSDKAAELLEAHIMRVGTTLVRNAALQNSAAHLALP
jgi:DNA-binding GntR family transcriptional regulator